MRILITGLSGTGKSTVIAILSGRGYDVVETDNAGWCVENGRHDSEWLWDEERMTTLLADNARTPLVISGCRENQGSFYDRFDEVLLFTAPLDVMLQRTISRSTNPFGKTPEEQRLIREQKSTIEPILRRTATRVIDTSMLTPDEVAGQVIAIMQDSR